MPLLILWGNKMIDIKKCKYKIVVDTREKVLNHILNKWDEGFEYKPSHHDMYRKIKSKYSDPVQYYKQEKGLETGDFTIAVQLPNGEQINFKDKVVIERKKDLNELCGNIFDKDSLDSDKLNRFERELKRAYEQGIKLYLLVEQSDLYSKILSSKHFRYDKASKVNPKSFLAILESLLARYNVELLNCDKKDSARIIHDKLYYWAREYLKGL